MREGGRSLAKIISVILFVIAILMWIGFACVVIGLVAILAGIDIGMEVVRGGQALGVQDRPTMLMLMVMAGAIVLLAINLVLRLRRVIRTVERGEPFHRDNPRDLRIIAILLAAVTGLGMAAKLLNPGAGVEHSDFDVSSWLAVLIIFVLAEVFREGARLRAESELTV